MANTLYFAVYPSAAATPTWVRANIGTNAGFSGSPTMYGTKADAPATGTNYEPTITWSSALTAGTPYKIAAIWDDGTNSSNSGVVFESAAFTTAALAELAATGASGTFSATASSPAVATLAATGATGTFSGSASSPATATLSATGGTGDFSGTAGASSSVELAATGDSGTFDGAAYGYTVSLSNIAAISITSTSAQPQLDYTINGTTGDGTTYFAVYPSFAAKRTWTRGSGWSNSPDAQGTDADPPVTSTTDDEPTITWDAALTAGVNYRIWAIWDDGTVTSDFGDPIKSDPFTPLLVVAELAATGGSGAFSGTASSTATATLAATGNTGTFAGTASTQATATLAATGGAGTFAGAASATTTAILAATGGTGAFSGAASSPATAVLSATGETGTFAGSAGASSAAVLTATGGTGTFSSSANSTATALLAAAGESGIFTGSAFSPAVAALAAMGGTGAFSGSASTQATATLSATGATGAFSGSANSTTSVALAALGGEGAFAGSASVPSGTAGAAEVWNYILSNGKSAEQTAVEIHAMLLDLHRIHGLELGSPLTVTETSRQAGAVLQAISEAAGAVVVTRQ